MTIKVGPSKKEYQVHRPILTYHFEYFRAAFEPGNFKEGATGELSFCAVADASIFNKALTYR